jgi:NAD(P)-dependent dehydrogenase (short-subunit alcohol dehydrogenase family)
MRLDGKVGLVTGGGSGIGRAAALALARAGARVVVADVSGESALATARGVIDAGGDAWGTACDVASAAQVAALVAGAVDHYGGLHCAFNNAGIEGGPPGTFMHEYAEETWEQVIDVNLKGVWLCLKYEIASMLASGGGAIVNTASIAGLTGGGNTAYLASKHGVIGLTRRAAVEYGPQGIRVNAVCPGSIRTPMLERLFGSVPEREQMLVTRTPLRRIGTADEVAQAVVWLCSDAASFVTGHPLVVDGGWMSS